MLHFATFFDSNYLSRGIALFDSLVKHSSEPFTLYVLALDKGAGAFFQKPRYDNVKVIYLEEIETQFSGLLEVKKTRSRIEYYFTLSPFLPSFIFCRYKNVDRLTTLDSDIYFFSDPKHIFSSYANASVLITPHNFSESLIESRKYGKYNVSFQSFKNNEDGNNCLTEWRNQCMEWCHDYLDTENDRYADQKYLDSWKDKFRNVEEIAMPGAGVAPWNINRYQFTIKEGKIFVDNEPLIYFHFHQLRIFNRYFASNAFEEYHIHKANTALKKVYHKYLNQLSSISKKIVIKDNITIRYHKNHTDLLSKITQTRGYWFFSKWFIYYINPNQVNKIKNFTRRFYG